MTSDRVLIDLNLVVGESALPADVRALLREAARRINRFQCKHHIPAFVTSDFRAAYATLRALAVADLAPGDLFCEWGSGFGVVTCLAAMLGFDAHGIEIEPDLVDAAQQLADDFDLPVEFVHSSFIPAGGARHAASANGFAWLSTEEARADEEMGLAAEDFAVVFAYPWPDEEQAIEDLFARYAGAGAVLLTYHGLDGLCLRQKPTGG